MNFNVLAIVLLVGGTVKRLVKLESLRRPFESQILTPWDMFFYVSMEEIGSHTSITPNSYHCFPPNGQSLSYVPCQLMRYLLLKIFMQAKGYL